MSKKFAALGICVLYLLALYVLLVMIAAGNLDRIADGQPIDWADLGHALQFAVVPSDAWRVVAIPVLLLIGWDAYTLLGRRFERANHPSPAEDPFAYARFLGRRYALIPVAVGVSVIFNRFSQREVASTALVIFWVAFIVARRPMNATFVILWTAIDDLFFDGSTRTRKR